MKYARIIRKAAEDPIFPPTLLKFGNWPLDLQPSINGLREFDARIREFSKLCFRVERVARAPRRD